MNRRHFWGSAELLLPLHPLLFLVGRRISVLHYTHARIGLNQSFSTHIPTAQKLIVFVPLPRH